MNTFPYEIAIKKVNKTFLSLSSMAPLGTLQYCRYPTGLACDFHNTGNCIHVFFVLTGRIDFEEKNHDVYSMAPSSVLIIPTNSTLKWSSVKDAEIFQMLVRPSGFNINDHGLISTLFSSRLKLTLIETGLELVRYVEKRITLAKLSTIKDIMHSLTAYLILEATLEKVQSNDLDSSKVYEHNVLSRSITYIEKNLFRNISLKELSRKSSLGVSRFSQLFREEFQMPPMQYVAHRKAEIARRLLSGRGLSITEVASQLGFNSVSYFTKFIKRHTGATPGELSQNS